MRLKCLSFLSFLLVTIWWGDANSGVLKSLNHELTALVAQSEPYLVTVKGNSKYRNLIATGIICDQLGHVITSSQVNDAESFEVKFRDGRTYSADKVGVDYLSGLAILKIIGGRFTAPKWAKTDKLAEQDWIAVVGNSYEVPATISLGYYNGLTDEGFLGLAVNANPGSSGGAVLNIDGQVVGVLVGRESGARPDIAAATKVSEVPTATSLLAATGDPTGRCYAVPIETVLDIAHQIIKSGKVRRGFLGICSQTITPDMADKMGLHGGTMVTSVDDNSPAAQAGIKIGDIITGVDSVKISNRGMLIYRVRSRKPGNVLTLGLVRNKEKLSVRVILGEAKDSPPTGGMKFSQSYPTYKNANELAATDSVDLKSELIRLQNEVARLQAKIDELESKPAK